MKLIPVHDRSGIVAYAKVDDSDYADLASVRWSIGRGYARRNAGGRVELMHRRILGLTIGDGLHTDHVNGDPLDNQRENLRVVTHAQNMQNTTARTGATSRHRGVYRKPNGKWCAGGRLNGREHYIGIFDSELDAARAAAAWRAEHLPFTNEQRDVRAPVDPRFVNEKKEAA